MINSILPIIIKEIRKIFVKKWKFVKSRSDNPYADELTVFINVKIESLNEFSKLIPVMLKKVVNNNKEIIKTNMAKKYLLISSKSKLIFEKISLFIKIFLGRLNERIWFKEYFNKE